MRFSVITPTFKRRTELPRAINSALEFIRTAGDSEIVVIDDASQDGTVDMIRTAYAAQQKSGLLKLFERKTNGGSATAKSDGASQASGDWLVFLDSDDELLPDAATHIPNFIKAHSDARVFFFRCVDQNGRLMGPPKLPARLSFRELLIEGTPGECLPVISRSAFLEFPSAGAASGYEFISTLRIARAYGYAMLSDSIVRRYHFDSANRLSSRVGNFRRARQHVAGIKQMVREFGSMMSLRQRLGYLIRIICYSAVAACKIRRAN
jgi:glycosyltransferase involved in cell wall biosynthesis